MFQNFKDSLPVITERIILQEPAMEELLEMREGILAEPIERMTIQPIKDESPEEITCQYQRALDGDDAFILGFRSPEGSQSFGKISGFNLNRRNRSIEIGYFTHKRYRKSRFTFYALKLIVDRIFSLTDMNRIHARTASFNTASIRLLEKCRFRQEAVLRDNYELDGAYHDELIFSILRREWESV